MAVSYIGLKLGSNNTWIYNLADGKTYAEPSMIAISNDLRNKQLRAVGVEAKKLASSGEKNTLLFMPISNGVVQYEDYATVMLTSFLNKVFPSRGFSFKIKAILSVPIGITEDEKKVFESVCFKSGINEVYMIPEVINFCLANNIDIKEKDAKMFVCIGSDVTNISILSSNTIISGYNVSIGGSLVSIGIVKYIEDKYLVKISNDTAELLKSEICSLYENYSAKMTVEGVNKLTGENETVLIEANELYSVVSYYYMKIVSLIKSILSSVSSETVADILKSGITFYGGATNIVGFDYFMKKHIGIKLTLLETPVPEVIGTEQLLKNPEKLKKIIKSNNLY